MNLFGIVITWVKDSTKIKLKAKQVSFLLQKVFHVILNENEEMASAVHH